MFLEKTDIDESSILSDLIIMTPATELLQNIRVSHIARWHAADKGIDFGDSIHNKRSYVGVIYCNMALEMETVICIASPFILICL